MANDFDEFPVYDPLVQGNRLSSIWFTSLSTFYQNLIQYLTSGGIIPPSLTTAERDALKAPQNGQTIYNITLDTAQYYRVSSGTWVSYP